MRTSTSTLASLASFASLSLVVALSACKKDEAPPAPPTATAAATVTATTATASVAKSAEQLAQERAVAAAKTLGGTLKKRLGDALAAGKVPEALDVCSNEAAALRAKVEQETGVRVGRASLRTRSPLNVAPEWVAEWLKAQGERPADGVAPFKQLAKTPDGEVARFIAPIAVDPLCLHCHGAKEGLSTEVKKLLAERYPSDAATGYDAGALRGALWAEAPVRR